MTVELNVDNLAKEATERLNLATTLPELEQWRVAYIGRKGALPRLLRTVKDAPLEQRRLLGAAANALRKKLEEAYEKKRRELGITNQELSTATEQPVIRNSSFVIPSAGHLHPITLTIRRVQEILSAMGFLIAEGPEVEEARYNFDLLNIPLEHSARGEMDTFHIADVTPTMVMRTHTSPVQLRAVLENNLQPPFRIASPGRVFRSERTDATHEHTFHQFEGLVVGTDVAIADFKGTVEQLYSSFFDRPANVRLRPGYFPFVEPGFEVDISCVFCEQKGLPAGRQGCRICKYTGWIEIMGAGMVHPNVLRNMNVDPTRYQGYAFGGAIDRLAMLRHNINDIRLFWSGDIRFLKQFS